MVTSEQEGMAEGRLSSASEGAHLSAPPPSVQGADSEDSDPTYMSMSQTSEADVATGLTSEPVLRQAPTPRAVSFVEPGHRMSGYSSRVWTISDGHTLNTEQVARGESQLEARDFNLPSSSNSVDVGTSPLRLSCETAQPSQSRSLHYIQHKPPWAFRANGLPSLDYTIISRPKQKAPKLRWTAGFSHLWDRIWTPVGVLSVIYVLLIVAWGSALFVIMMGWTSLPLLLRFPWIEICSQVLTALFAITGIGFLPWRLRDTYHVMIILDYSRLARVREKRQTAQGVLGAQPPNELSELPPATAFERALLQKQESTVVLVLSERERRHLRRSVRAKSKTWFRPLGTLSEKATSLGLVAAIVLLNDLNSIFQCVLCGFMWGLSPLKRPLWVLAMAVCGALLSSAVAGLLLAIGSSRTRKPIGRNRKAFEEWEKEGTTRESDLTNCNIKDTG